MDLDRDKRVKVSLAVYLVLIILLIYLLVGPMRNYDASDKLIAILVISSASVQ